ncbi:GNAT family N-acetyltransferase [Neobittarella massiliensis]|uniref:GNAT family N-acetyltransferase n=1 Tax=Neobittarella massiliensis (ex Bilen et al. 2018) TaxID=2041842 RepID=UPI000CF709AE|nr:GNAT family N-acetyltransferase [Neobittarella massiliensis]
MPVIDTATRADWPALKTIWQACFGDESSYIDLFLEDLFDSCIPLVWRQEGQPVAMLYLLPVQLVHTGQAQSWHYLYAAATLPSCQGRGLMGQLLKAARQSSAQAGAAGILLVPGEKSLFQYYARFGYATYGARRQLCLAADELSGPAAVISPLPPPQLAACRRQALAGLGLSYMAHSPAGYRHICREAAYLGGGVYHFNGGHCVVHRDGDTALVKELAAADTATAAAVLRAVCGLLGTARLLLTLPPQGPLFAGLGQVLPAAMSLPPPGPSAPPAFIDLVLD